MLDFNEYLRRINYHPNSARIPDNIIIAYGEEKRKEELEIQKTNKIMQMQKDIETQKSSQDAMAKHLQELVALQHEYNVIIQNQCEELKMQNVAQRNELKKQKIWNWITYGITTAIAVVSVIATFISIF